MHDVHSLLYSGEKARSWLDAVLLGRRSSMVADGYSCRVKGYAASYRPPSMAACSRPANGRAARSAAAL